MSIEDVDEKVKQQIDQIATIKKSVASFMQTILATTDDGVPVGQEMPSFWNIVDSSNDQDYENTVKGQDITDMDVSLLNGGNVGNILNAWFDYHESYYQLKRGYSNGFSGWLDVNHLRVAESFNSAYEESRGISLDPKYVFMDDSVYKLASIVAKVTTLENGGFVKSESGDTRLAVTMQSGISTGSAVLSLVLGDKTDEFTRSIDVTIQSNISTTDKIIIGQVTPSAISSSEDESIITVPNISNFKANTYIAVSDSSNSNVEYLLVNLVTPTSGGAGTLTISKLITQASAANLRVAPTFDNIESLIISSGIGNLKVVSYSDRLIKVY